MTSNVNIHRLLDEAFAGAPRSATTADLKEELRANLTARVAELESEGTDTDAAAEQAFDELGDVSVLLADAEADPTPQAEWQRHKVRYPTAFVVRVTVLSILAGAILLASAFWWLAASEAMTRQDALPASLPFLLFVLLVGFITADSLQQETTTNFAMPRRRAVAYGAGVGLLLYGVVMLVLCALTAMPDQMMMELSWGAGGLLTVAGIGTLAGLGASQTNRKKPWVVALAAKYQHTDIGTRFEADPNAAARFGIYTMLIWVVAVVAAVALGTHGVWGWVLPLVAAFVAMMLLLTRMLFTPDRTGR
ncbi:MAG: permease prefix domain 1-containing protein [Micrococcales bacterium]|nr:permease prefix domain 1-containing protein [Micrococcales bacterium]